MKARYIAVYKIHGANKLPNDADRVDLFSLQFPSLIATLTTNPEPDFLHIDKSEALGAQLLKSVFAPDKKGTLEERLAAEIEEVKAQRTKRIGNGVSLVFNGETDIPTAEFDTRRDTYEFGVCLNAIPKNEIRERFHPSVQGVMTALSLSLPANADRDIEKIGDVVFLIDSDTGKPVYSFTLQGFAEGSIASPLTRTVFEEAAALAPKLDAQKNITRPASLLLTSLEKATDELQAFIAAWSALEIFVNATFKSTYEIRWFSLVRNGAPASAMLVFERFRDVMSDKYRLADKFLVIACVLDPTAANGDATEFRRLKRFRDELLHALDTPPSALPTEAVQKLLLKYMRLHLVTPG